MNTAAGLAVVALGAAVGLLLLSLVLGRVRTGRRLAHERPIRERYELALALVLAAEGAAPQPRSREERRVLRAVALDALIELRGRERDRVTALVEQAGVVDEALAELGSRRASIRRHGAETLAEARSRKGVDALLRGLGDRDRSVAIACARGLVELGDDSVLQRVLPVIEEAAEQAPGAAAELLLALGAHAPHAFYDPYRAARSVSLRRLVVAVIGELRLVEHVDVLREALRDADDELVSRAARGLALIGDTEAVDRLVDLLEADDRSLFVRVACAVALGRLGDARAVPALERALADESWLLSGRAAVALSELGSPGQAALERAAGSGNVHARTALA